MIYHSSPFGLVAWLADTRIQLPLIHIETRFRVTGGVAWVEIDQVFEQTAREPLDVTYTFPLPGAAAVNRCEMIINGRVVRAVVKETEEARRVAADEKAKGRRTALVEMDRGNLFTLQLGNVAPADRIVIRLAYVEELNRLKDQLSLRIPFSPGVRYIPGKPLLRKNRGRGVVDDTDQVPDASRITPPRITRDHHDAATLYLHGVFEEGEADLRSLDCPTHPAAIRQVDSTIEVELCGEQHFPDGDFVLRWNECTTSTTTNARAWSCSDGAHTYALLQLRAPEIDMLAPSNDVAQDIYFLVDRSGSMQGMKWTKCAEALHAFVRELGANDRVWITCFESEFQDFAEAPMERDAILDDPGFQELAQVEVGGGTELLPALNHVLKMCARHRSDRPARLILLTDGQVGNEAEILRRMKRRDAAGLSIHCFGIDDAVNDAFLQSLARQTGGCCSLMTPTDNIPAAVKRLAQSLRRPVLTDLRVQSGGVVADDTPQLPDLNAGEVTLVAVRVGLDAREAVIQGTLLDGSAWTHRMPFTKLMDSESPRLLWARRRCAHLVQMEEPKKAVAIAIEHNIVCPGASFIAWDEMEKLGVATREICQPSMAPAGGSVTQCFATLSCAPAAPASYGGKTFGSRSFHIGGVEMSTDVPLPVRVPQLPGSTPMHGDDFLEELTQRYGELEADSRSQLWVTELLSELVDQGLSLPEAEAFITVLLKWMSGLLGWQRQNLLTDFLRRRGFSDIPTQGLRHFIRRSFSRAQSIPPTEPLLDALRAFAQQYIRGRRQADLIQLLARTQSTQILAP